MKLYLKLYISVIIFGLSACIKNTGKEETLYVQPENLGWVEYENNIGEFTVVDDNGISSSFIMFQNGHYFVTSSSGYIGVTTNITQREHYYKNFRSTFSVPFSISLSASFTPFGDELYIELDRVGFAFDLHFETISRVYTDFGNISRSTNSTGYEQGGGIESTAELLESFSTDFNQYEKVLRFELHDFENKWDDFTVVKIYIAKDAGLVKFQLNNGLSFQRTYPTN